MTTAAFTEAARAAFADDWRWKRPRSGDPVTQHATEQATEEEQKLFFAGAEWARTHLAAQEPTDAEVLAMLNVITGEHYETLAEGDPADVGDSRAALRAARDVRAEA